MTFYERFISLCKSRGFDCVTSKELERFLGIKKQTINHWSQSDKAPTGDSVVRIADAFHVSTDYLLGRTDNPVDYSDFDLTAALSGPQLDALDGDVKKALALQQAIAENVKREKEAEIQATQVDKGVLLYGQLDAVDKGKAEGYMQGLLDNDKYFTQSQAGTRKPA